MQHDPVVYGKPGCKQCQFTTKVLEKEGVPFNYIDITVNPVAEEHVKALGYSSVPVVQVGDEHWFGFRPERLRSLHD
jgi:glutaredoxin-like protein NrdH